MDATRGVRRRKRRARCVRSTPTGGRARAPCVPRRRARGVRRRGPRGESRRRRAPVRGPDQRQRDRRDRRARARVARGGGGRFAFRPRRYERRSLLLLSPLSRRRLFTGALGSRRRRVRDRAGARRARRSRRVAARLRRAPRGVLRADRPKVAFVRGGPAPRVGVRDDASSLGAVRAERFGVFVSLVRSRAFVLAAFFGDLRAHLGGRGGASVRGRGRGGGPRRAACGDRGRARADDRSARELDGDPGAGLVGGPAIFARPVGFFDALVLGWGSMARAFSRRARSGRREGDGFSNDADDPSRLLAKIRVAVANAANRHDASKLGARALEYLGDASALGLPGLAANCAARATHASADARTRRRARTALPRRRTSSRLPASGGASRGNV